MLDKPVPVDAETLRLMRSPAFRALTRERTSFGWTLSGIMLVVYFSFILLAAFDRDLMASKLGGSTISLGIVLGLFVIVVSFLLTGVYVARANTRFDQLTRDLKKGL